MLPLLLPCGVESREKAKERGQGTSGANGIREAKREPRREREGSPTTLIKFNFLF